jgi:ankyrin repeat protein
MFAAWSKATEVVQYLLERGATKEIMNTLGMNALTIALDAGKEQSRNSNDNSEVIALLRGEKVTE